jgi:hypothetical protein
MLGLSEVPAEGLSLWSVGIDEEVAEVASTALAKSISVIGRRSI